MVEPERSGSLSASLPRQLQRPRTHGRRDPAVGRIDHSVQARLVQSRRRRRRRCSGDSGAFRRTGQSGSVTATGGPAATL
ncbi:hypothetical protein NL676_020389 [Syzygium grande]|nr:hypothetical protein NL676_020389 [Syzygium grande]